MTLFFNQFLIHYYLCNDTTLQQKSFKTIEMTNSMSDDFTLKRMASLFKSCVEIDDPEKVDLDCYINAWVELIK